MLYQWEVGREAPDDVLDSYWTTRKAAADDEVRTFAAELVRGTAARLSVIDPLIAQAAEHWRLDRIAIIDRLILRLATYELLDHPGTPAPVVINEALELARTFSTDESVGFVNGVLDAIRKRLARPFDEAGRTD